jgi:hypothetical protein
MLNRVNLDNLISDLSSGFFSIHQPLNGRCFRVRVGANPP